jgi:Zn-dependent protease with chaperone function
MFIAKKETFENDYITTSLEKLWGIPKENFVLKRYSGKYSYGAFTDISPIKSKKGEIFLGEKLLSDLTDEEIIFVISHEIGHNSSIHRLWNMKTIFALHFGFPVFYGILLFFFTPSLPNVNILIILTILISIIGISAINFVWCQMEFDADKNAITITKDIETAERAFRKMEKRMNARDFGKLLNLLLYDHPLFERRIERIKDSVTHVQ